MVGFRRMQRLCMGSDKAKSQGVCYLYMIYDAIQDRTGKLQ